MDQFDIDCKAAEIINNLMKDLGDRGVFNGIDDDLMLEIHEEMLETIIRALSGADDE